LWILIAGCLNYLSLYMLLKKLLGYGEIASNAGAFLFAFGSSRMMQEWHRQLVPEFYVVLSLTGLIFLFRDEKRRPIWGAALFFGGLLLQIYTAAYWAFFLIVCVTLALVFALCRRDWRNPLLARLLEQAWPIGCAAVASLVLVAPLLIQSYNTAQQVGTRVYEEVRGYLPGWTSWFQQMPGSLVYGRLYGFFDSRRNPSFWEDSNGLGFVTTAMICLGFWAGRRRPLVALLGLVSVAIVILTLRLPSGWSLWAGVYSVSPGGKWGARHLSHRGFPDLAFCRCGSDLDPGTNTACGFVVRRDPCVRTGGNSELLRKARLSILRRSNERDGAPADVRGFPVQPLEAGGFESQFRAYCGNVGVAFDRSTHGQRLERRRRAGLGGIRRPAGIDDGRYCALANGNCKLA
jgi:hypothetical protein